MTLSKLARLANVSLSVVSKAFSGKGDVSDAMREHVFAVAKEHGCFNKFYHARYDKPVVAVIIPEAISKFYIHYIETLKKDMEENGYTMLLSISNFDNALCDELIRYYAEHSKVDGLIVLEYDKLPENSHTAFVCLSGGVSTNGSFVFYDEKKGVRESLERLKAFGHTRIAYIGEPLVPNKATVLRAEMKELGMEINEEMFYVSRLRFERAGIDGVKAFWNDLIEKPTAIFGAYGYITQGILSELERMGISVPDEVSVISMDNDPFPIHPSLDVSCIPSGIESVCQAAMSVLRERIGSDSPNSPLNVNIDSEFHTGQTLAPCPVITVKL